MRHKLKERLKQEVECWLHYDPEAFNDCARYLGCSPETLASLFTEGQLGKIKDLWAQKTLRASMDELSQEANVREDFTVKRLIEHAKEKERETTIGDLQRRRFRRLVGEEWRAITANLPRHHEVLRSRVLALLEEEVQANTPFVELTQARLIERVEVTTPGFTLRTGEWLAKPLRAAIRQLKVAQQNHVEEPPVGQNIISSRGAWVNLDAEEWDLRSAGGGIIKRGNLRTDVAEIAWPILRKELLKGEIAIASIYRHYYAYISAGRLLGKEVSNLRLASLEAVQRAWHVFKATNGERTKVLYGLKSLFINLGNSVENALTLNRREYLRIAVWLCLSAKVPTKPVDGDSLSAGEMKNVISACMSDINDGFAFIRRTPHWTTMSSSSKANMNGSAITRLTIAMMILLMSVTGLRRQSVANITTGDWMEIFPGLFALAWRHSKCGHEDVVAVSSSIIELLQSYVTATEPMRNELMTDHVFLIADKQAAWQPLSSANFPYLQLKSFAKRHGIERDGTPISLRATLLRYTYATQELYRGVSLQIIQRQLGHLDERTTKHYVKFDLFEHPAHVHKALDQYGIASLRTWESPVMLDALESGERAAIFAARVARDQEVGLCRNDHCVKMNEGGPPPCALCNQLATGPEFLNEWQNQHEERLKEIERLSSIPAAAHDLAEKQHQLRLFEHNYTYVKERCKE